MSAQRKDPPSKAAREEQDPEETAPAAAAGDLETALASTFPDVVVCDRELELPGGPVVDLACVDSAGRVLLVAELEGAGDACVLRALDLLASVRENRVVLYRHLAHPGLRVDLPPLTVLVAERFDDEVLARLACAEAGTLRCLERRTVRSRAGASVHLVDVAHGAAAVEAPGAVPGEFCRHLAPEQRELGLTLVGRLSRIDEELEHTGLERGGRWSLAGDAVCSVFAHDGRLEGFVAPRTVPEGIESVERMERFVERALERTVELLGATGPAGPSDPRREAALDPLQPILTPEEIQAFRDL